MLNTILVDSGPLIALFDKDDHYHNQIISFLKGKRYKFVTTIAVLTEVAHMLDFSMAAQILFFEWVLQEGVIIHEIHQSDIARIIDLIKKYNDLPMDFADATLVVTAEKTNIQKIISLDSDFDIYRLHRKVIIKNVFKSLIRLGVSKTGSFGILAGE